MLELDWPNLHKQNGVTRSPPPFFKNTAVLKRIAARFGIFNGGKMTHFGHHWMDVTSTTGARRRIPVTHCSNTTA